MSKSNIQGGGALLPDPEVAARVALACAGLTGDPTIGAAIRQAENSAAEVVDELRTKPGETLPVEFAQRLIQFGNPEAVTRALEHTRHHRMRLLLPEDPDWPPQLAALGLTEPVILWAAGDASVLLDPPIVLTGDARPSSAGRQSVIELATLLADAGWIVAATARPGVDALALDAASAIEGDTILVATAARPAHPHSVAVSENPPGQTAILGAMVRAHVLLAALAAKVVVVEAQLGSGAMRTALAAYSFGRPIGVADDRTAGSRRLRHRHDAGFVATLADVERLHP